VRRPLRLSALLGLACVLAVAPGCAARTTLSSVWSAQEIPPEPMGSVLVIGIGTTETARRQYEDHFATELEKRGVRATASYRALPEEGRIARSDLARVVRGGGYEGVVITRLLKVDREETYVPPQTSMSMGYGGGWYGYYGSAWGINYSPGYVQTTTIVRLETRLYDAREDELVWSAHSDTFQPSDVDDVIESVTKKVVGRLAEDGWIR
jgi:hypothetical protein